MRKLTLRDLLATLITVAVVVPFVGYPVRGSMPLVQTIFTLGIYLFWWFYNQMDEPNKHFANNWAQEDDLVNAVDALS